MGIDRERKANLETMDPAQVDSTAVEMGKRITKILEEAKAEADRMLSIYGLQLDLGYEIKSKGQKQDA
jgi:hypothetical protein